jgi:hypothetical protein
VWSRDEAAYLLTAADGSWARLRSWSPADEVPPDLARWAAPPPSLGVVLIRRGGYAVGLADGVRLLRHRTGRRYVQGRTAAGGWSQQRYARRRANQVDALVSSAVEVARDVLVDTPPAALVLGGDRSLGHRMLATTALAGLGTLPRRELPDIADPRFAALRQSVARGRCVQVTVHNTDG